MVVDVEEAAADPCADVLAASPQFGCGLCPVDAGIVEMDGHIELSDEFCVECDGVRLVLGYGLWVVDDRDEGIDACI